MFKILLCVAAGLLATCASTPPQPKASTASLKEVVLTLPPQYFADCPFKHRQVMLDDLCSDQDTYRWAPDDGWMNYFSDSGYISASSMIYLRLLRSLDGKNLVFVHMPKPFADGRMTPGPNQTFVLQSSPEGQWLDVTASVMPATVDMTAHFRPLRSKPLVEVAAYDKVVRADGKGNAYQFGKCMQELHWNGTRFEMKSVPPRPLTEST